MTSRYIPNPGSIVAFATGCCCPIERNNYGEGIPSGNGRQFVYAVGCPLHDVPTIVTDDEEPEPGPGDSWPTA